MKRDSSSFSAQLSRHTEPENDHRLLLQRLKVELPAQPPPQITAAIPAKPPDRSLPVDPTFGLTPQRFQSLRLDHSRELVKSG